jgi:hypothetical protein
VFSGPNGTADVKLNDDTNPAGTFYIGADGVRLDPSPGPCPRCS